MLHAAFWLLLFRLQRETRGFTNRTNRQLHERLAREHLAKMVRYLQVVCAAVVSGRTDLCRHEDASSRCASTRQNEQECSQTRICRLQFSEPVCIALRAAGQARAGQARPLSPTTCHAALMLFRSERRLTSMKQRHQRGRQCRLQSTCPPLYC
jgi:hypothetical protein